MDIEGKVILEIITIIIAIKVFSFILAPLSWAVLKNQPCDIISLWNRWDAPNYIDIAKNGYTNVGEGRWFIVFLPLYPFLIRLLATFIGNYEVSALLISNLASIFACFYLYKLAKIDYSESTALKSVFFLAIFPTSYFLIAGYTESLFLLLTIGCFYYARKAKWSLAGVLGMLAAATRITGLVLLPSLLCEYFSQHSKPGSRRVRDIFFIALVSVGFVSYLIVNYVVFGDAFAFLAVQHEHWFKQLAPPWEGLLGAIWGIFWRDPAGKALTGVAEALFGLSGFFCIAYAFVIKLRPSYTAYMLLTWLVVTSTSYWLSTPRYLLSMFPIFIMFALIADKREEWFYVLTTAFLLFFSFFLVLFTQGYWAF